MKTDLATSIIAAIAGVLIAYFVTNLFMGPIEDVSYKTIDSTVNTNLSDPDPEVFNYRALNPTVEVYVGECEEYNTYGECIEVTDTETNVEESTDGGAITESVNVEEGTVLTPENSTQENQ